VKKIFIFLFILTSASSYAQSDSAIILNTPRVFSVTFTNHDKSLLDFSQYATYDEVYLDTLTKDFLIIERKYTDLKNPGISTRVEKIPVKDIKSIGYVSGSQDVMGAIVGAGIGTIAGIIIGIAANTYDKASIDPKYDKKNSPVVPVVAGLVIGAGLGYALGGMLDKYEHHSVVQYKNMERKFQEIQKIIQKGMDRFKRY
jgi:hypothetical protein